MFWPTSLGGLSWRTPWATPKIVYHRSKSSMLRICCQSHPCDPRACDSCSANAEQNKRTFQHHQKGGYWKYLYTLGVYKPPELGSAGCFFAHRTWALTTEYHWFPVEDGPQKTGFGRKDPGVWLGRAEWWQNSSRWCPWWWWGEGIYEQILMTNVYTNVYSA